MNSFESINAGYDRTFRAGEMSIGVVVPIENYEHGPVPSMTDHLSRVQLIEGLGFSALWIRDIPLNIPSFGDAGQTFDPFTYLGFLAGKTHTISLGISSIALPLHHPLHVAKSAATIAQLSQGRLILGVASGDRPGEYPAMGVDFDNRGQLFRDAFQYIRSAQERFPKLDGNHFGTLHENGDILPKPYGKKLPLLITGSSRQTPIWNAENGDGWMNYPKNLYAQQHTIREWRQLIHETGSYDKPFMQPLYIMLEENADFKPMPIHLGFRIGINYLVDYFHQLKDIGVNHVALNLRFQHIDVPAALEKIADKVLPHFYLQKQKTTL